MTMLKDDRWCFACGPDNPHGLHLRDFRHEGDYYLVHFTPQRPHQGWQGITHGGVVATLLDEAMTRLIRDRGHDAVTAELTVRYHHPVPTGEPLTVRARLLAQRRRLLLTEAEVLGAGGTPLASASAKFICSPD